MHLLFARFSLFRYDVTWYLIWMYQKPKYLEIFGFEKPIGERLFSSFWNYILQRSKLDFFVVVDLVGMRSSGHCVTARFVCECSNPYAILAERHIFLKISGVLLLKPLAASCICLVQAICKHTSSHFLFIE